MKTRVQGSVEKTAGKNRTCVEVNTLDRYEYNVLSAKIKELIAEGEFAKAVEIADQIDWRKVRSVMTLCTISDLYKINRRYAESKDILLMAYERHPEGRLIVYSLCELSIKLEEYVQAIEYYKEFVNLAPKDTSRYILQYRLYEAQEVSLEERIAVLEEFKKRDYREKWAYELAYLYHRVGLASKCVEECDEMFLWFGEGKYVLKALELKMLHAPLDEEQKKKYDLWSSHIQAGVRPEEAAEVTVGSVSDISASTDEKDIVTAPTTEIPISLDLEDPGDDIQVKPMDMGLYNTVNLQQEIAKGMQGIFDEENTSEEATMDAGEEEDEIPQISDMPDILEESDLTAEDGPLAYVSQDTKVISGKPGKVSEQLHIPEIKPQTPVIDIGERVSVQEAQQVINLMRQDTASLHALAKVQEETVPGAKTGVLTPANTLGSPFDNVLTQEYDGQIKLAVPDPGIIEKQITGQMSIEDVLAEWEKMKQENEEKRKGEVRQRILQHTGGLFDEFDEATKSGLLEQLEKAFVEAIMKEAEKDNETPALKEEIVREAKAAVERVHQERAQEEESLTAADVTEEPGEEKAGEKVTEKEASEKPALEESASEVTDLEEPETPPEEKDEAVLQVQEALADHEQEAKAKQKDLAKKKAAREASKSTTGRTDAREFTAEERKTFEPFLKNKKSREQVLFALENMSLSAYTGNVIITGEEGAGTLDLAKNLIKEMQKADRNFSGQVAKISGAALNNKDIQGVLETLKGGAIIVESATALKKSTVTKLVNALNNENLGILIILEGAKKPMSRMVAAVPGMAERFNVRIDIEVLGDAALIAYAKEYAMEQEYVVDAFAEMALQRRIENLQTYDHEVTLAEVRELVDEAIYYAGRKTPAHLLDLMLGKRYDAEDMIIIREKDFMHDN